MVKKEGKDVHTKNCDVSDVLSVTDIKFPVEWNRRAFDSVRVTDNRKELIRHNISSVC